MKISSTPNAGTAYLNPLFQNQHPLYFVAPLFQGTIEYLKTQGRTNKMVNGKPT